MQENNGQGVDSNWAYREENAAPAAPANSVEQSVSWTASEFIAHQKNSGWYATVIGVAVVLCAAVLFITKDIISVVAIAVVALLFLVASSRKPAQRTYSVDDHGIAIDEKFYPYSIFKSFSVDETSVIGSVTFMPLKRFMPEISIYFPPEDEDKILTVLGENLPNDQRREQGVDQLMKRLRF